MMSDYVNWQKTSRRRLERQVADMKLWIDENGEQHSEYTKKKREYTELKLHLKQFLDDSFQEYLPGQWKPKYDRLEDLVSKEMTCEVVGQYKLCSMKCCLQRCNECRAIPRNR